MSRVCACPLREPMDGMPAKAIYRHGARCRQRAYRARVQAEAAEAGLVVAPSRAAIARMLRETGSRNGDAPRAGNGTQRRRSGLQVSYRKAVDAVCAIGLGRELVETALRSALSDRQREQLEGVSS